MLHVCCTPVAGHLVPVYLYRRSEPLVNAGAGIDRGHGTGL